MRKCNGELSDCEKVKIKNNPLDRGFFLLSFFFSFHTNKHQPLGECLTGLPQIMHTTDKMFF